MNKKGSLSGFLDNYQFILTVIMILIIGVGFLWGLFTLGPIAGGKSIEGFNAIKTSVKEGSSDNTSFTNATIIGSNMAINIIGKMEYLIYAVFIGCIIGFIIFAYEVKFYPYLSFVWLILMILVVIFSIVISNEYQRAASNELTSSFYSTWGTSKFLMSNLPILTVVFGIITGVLLFILKTRMPDEEIYTGTVGI